MIDNVVPSPLLLVLIVALVTSCSDSHDAEDAAMDSAPPTESYSACDVTSECVLAQPTCCEECFELNADEVVGVTRDERGRFFEEVACPGGPTGCPRCAPVRNQSLIATCDTSAPGGGMCSVVDLENDPRLAGCTTDDECSVRVPDCCECGASIERSNLIALNATGVAEVSALVCDPDSTCPTCAPVYPTDVEAVCHPVLNLCRLADADEPRPGDYFSCESVADCTLSSPACCDWCGRARIEDLVAIHEGTRNDYRDAVACPDGPPEGCPDCITELNPNLVATCTAGSCEVFDIETDELASCMTAADCVVRTAECCECGALLLPETLVAMNRDAVAAYLPRVCDPAADCAGCSPDYPPEISADCVAGLCQLVGVP